MAAAGGVLEVTGWEPDDGAAGEREPGVVQGVPGAVQLVVLGREDGYGCILRLWRSRLPRAGAGQHPIVPRTP